MKVRYDFKAIPEVWWGIIIAVSVVLLNVLVTFDPMEITDWRSWLLGVLGGMVRAFAVACLAALGRRETTPAPDPWVAPPPDA